ncbi:hypothetical protein QE152_g34967 [Popillia japonica]|uniref:Uncharacterized protein n=1 Tax=Popillia japonica TaxID=7064 RepID=A0AAW1ISV7_POPJA
MILSEAYWIFKKDATKDSSFEKICPYQIQIGTYLVNSNGTDHSILNLRSFSKTFLQQDNRKIRLQILKQDESLSGYKTEQIKTLVQEEGIQPLSIISLHSDKIKSKAAEGRYEIIE